MISRTLVASALSVMALSAVGEAAACPAKRPMAGVVQQVTGARTDVFVERAGETRFRPTPLDVLCAGDVLVTSSPSAMVMYRLEGAQTSTRLRGPARVELVNDARRTVLADNALQILLDSWMPDMRRTSNFGVVRGRSEGPARWTFAGLSDGAAQVQPGSHPLMLRWSGPTAGTRVQITTETGAEVANVAATGTEARVPTRNWAPGVYNVRVTDTGMTVLKGKFRVAATPIESANNAFGAEIAAAAEGMRLARTDARRYSLQAAQLVDSAPQQGLDRDALYRAIGALNEDE